MMGCKAVNAPVRIMVVLVIMLFSIPGPTQGIKCYNCSDRISFSSCQEPLVLVDCDKEKVKYSKDGTNFPIPYDRCAKWESAINLTKEGRRVVLARECSSKFYGENLPKLDPQVRKCRPGIQFSECMRNDAKWMWLCAGDGCNNGKATGSSKLLCLVGVITSRIFIYFLKL